MAVYESGRYMEAESSTSILWKIDEPTLFLTIETN